VSENQYHLFQTPRFLPLFITQFLGALNDNFFKNALVILVLYRLAEAAGLDGQILVTVAAGVFILPFFLFSATAGQLADKFEKSRLIRLIKLAEILIMGLAVGGFLWGDPYLMLAVLFLMGTQSTFFGPLKYAILPDHLHEAELIGGNALIEAGTFLAILIGTILGGVMILTENGIWMVSASIVVLAACGWLSSFFIPRAEPPSPDLKLNPNVLAETWNIIRAASSRRDIRLTILGISWFWLVGATFLAQFPSLAKNVIGANEHVVTLFLTIFSIGIGLGSLLCNKLLDGEITAKFVPFGALGMTLFTLDLFFATSGLVPTPGELQGIDTFLSQLTGWRILTDLAAISVCGGIFIVPLYAILQARSEAAHRARTVAANNIMNALFMVVGAAGATLMLSAEMSVPSVFLAVALVNGVVAIYICGLLPDAIVKAAMVVVLRILYRVKVRGGDNIKLAGKRAVIVANHVSFLDGVLLGAFLPTKPIFAVYTLIARQWWLKPFFAVVDVFPMDPTNPMAIKSLIKAVQEDRHCVIFPEGRLTVTGSLMKVYEGPGMIADKADAMLVPVRIDGAQYTPFSRLKGKVRLRWFPKITITILEPRRFEIPEGVVGRARRQLAGAKLHGVMSQMIFETCDYRRTLFDALLDARAIHGGSHPVLEDVERKLVRYDGLILGSFVIGRKLARLTSAKEYVGLMLPNSIGTAVAFFGLQAFGRVPALLNYSTGTKNMISALTAAETKTILTSRRFVEMAKFDDVIEALAVYARIIYLEDLREDISIIDKVVGLFARLAPRLVHRRANARWNDPAVVLFTSGSEGTPKGVVLSHGNLLANRHQLAAVIDFNPTDIVFNALPIFHSFGLTAGTLLPTLSGVKTFLYPSPLHYRIVPTLVYDTNSTIMFGTDTFLAGYARVAHPYDFYSLRYVFAGAEKVKDETRNVWSDRFGLRILEGYGATETSPVISTNTPMHFKAGTVGPLLPGIAHELEPVPGIEEGGKLIVSGPNVMLGYLRAENPGILEEPEDRRYDTGDIVSFDDHGFVTIQGRVKRFAKIAGEMVSLGAVEGYANAVWPEHVHVVVSIPDARKGEQLVLVTEKADADRESLLTFAKDQGVAELMIPRSIQIVDRIPLLGTGKVDYVGVRNLVDVGV
jgi:acyl-[acyl-carrier-protein]-phospholipid O-acyltransferase/long-chain-fatty-acid--[acyl-carrier-protein] ligase